MRNLKNIDLKSLTLILTGTIIWSLTMVKSGITYSYGMGFWGPNGHDGVWHIALIKSLIRGSWNIPVMGDMPLQNYHIGFDLFTAIIYKLTFIPVEVLYFQILPPLFSLLLGVFAYLFVYEWRKSKEESFWSLFFIYFGGSWGWVVNLFRGQNIGGESMFWAQQSISTLINPPFAMSLVILFAALYVLVKGIHKNKKGKYFYLFVSSLLFGLLIEIKVYAGILALAGLGVAGMWQLLKRDGISLIKVFTGALIISLMLFLPLFNPNVRTIVWQPFWFLDTMMSVSDRFYWPKYADALMNYRASGNYIKLIPAYGVAFLIFWYGNLGTRILKEFQIWKWIRKFPENTWVEIFVTTVILVGLMFPLFFLQEGTPWNTIQFLYYSLVFSGIVAGISFGEWFVKTKSSRFRWVASILLVLFTLPTTYGTLGQYLPSRPPSMISNTELNALTFLEKQPEGIVLTYPFNEAKAQAAVNNPPRPLYLYESTAYVSAFSNKPTFLEDEVNLNITGYDWRVRRAEVEEFYKSLDEEFAYNFLRENNIAYMYLLKDQRAVLGEAQLGIENIYENGEVTVYRVK